MKITVLFLGMLYFVLTTISCSTTPKHWYRPGGTVAMYERDQSDCEKTQLETPTTGSQAQLYTFESCMESKGWVALDGPPM